MTPQFFRKKPVVIEAIQFTEKSLEACLRFISPKNVEWWSKERITIRTLEGSINASPGDWIIKGVAGEFYPCRADIFEQTYETAEKGQ